jgi:hypothetical protein
MGSEVKIELDGHELITVNAILFYTLAHLEIQDCNWLDALMDEDHSLNTHGGIFRRAAKVGQSAEPERDKHGQVIYRPTIRHWR